MRESLEAFYREVMERKYAFLLVFFVVILLTYSLLYALDFYPEPPTQNQQGGGATASSAPAALIPTAEASTTSVPAPSAVKPAVDPYPNEIIFDSLHKTVHVSNPDTTNLKVLDKALLKGAVRYPTSATLASPGNVFILAHSSYLPKVINHNYQAFDGIQNLKWGDTIRLRTADTEYVYHVERVYKAKTSDVVVNPSPGQAKLTLATCNVFGTKQDRFIVEANLAGSHPLTTTQSS